MKYIKSYFFLNPFLIISIVVIAYFILMLLVNHISASDGRKAISDDRQISSDTTNSARGGCLPFNKACLIMQ